jgi:N-acetylmuramoyl-L-alanine amidase
MERVANALKAILENEYVCTVYVAPTALPIEMYGRPLDAFTKDADVHLAIHSNANSSGTSYGASAYYFPACAQSLELSQNIVAELGKVSPYTSTLSQKVVNGMLGFNGIGYGDVRNPSHLGMIGVLAEVEYHDNADSAQWIINNTDSIARALANALETTLGMQKK